MTNKQSGTSAIYEATDIEFEYTLGSEHVHALRGVSLSIPHGAFVCLMGPSGSGKTTLLNLFGLIEQMQKGRLTLLGDDVSTMTEGAKNNARRFRIGFVFQTFQLIPVLRADENVDYFLARQGLPSKERKLRVEESLSAVGLWEHRMKKPLEMSGGQRQRVAIARALAKKPEVIIADEPTASVDQKTGRELMETFAKIHDERKVAIVVSSHDPMVQSFAPSRIMLQDGKITGTHALGTESVGA
jgi:putative ABC transport system ATP-binding protein